MKFSALKAIAMAVGPVMISSCSAHLHAAPLNLPNVTAFPGAEGFGALATGGRGGGSLFHPVSRDCGKAGNRVGLPPVFTII